MSFVNKYLPYAKFYKGLSKATNNKVGACLIPEHAEVPIGGYNGPPRGIPEINNWGRFTDDQIQWLRDKTTEKFGHFAFTDADCCHPELKTDPRYLLGYESGTGARIMIDAHAERNCIINAARAGITTVNSTMIVTSGIPCKDCMIEIIQAGVVGLYFCKSDLGLSPDNLDYNYYASRWLLKKSGLFYYEYPEDLLND